jgi:hypothetical protein
VDGWIKCGERHAPLFFFREGWWKKESDGSSCIRLTRHFTTTTKGTGGRDDFLISFLWHVPFYFLLST